MEAALLLGDVLGMVLLLLWVWRRNPHAGLFAWRSAPPTEPTPPDRP